MASSIQLQRVSSTNPLATLFSRIGLLSILLGFIVILFNFSALIEKTAADLFPGSAFTRGVGYVLLLPKQLHSTDLLYTCAFACFCGVWLYLAMMLILALARRKIALAGQGLLSFITGVLILPLLGWCVLLLYWMLWVVLKVVGFVFYIIGIIFNFLLSLMHYLWPVLLAAIIISLIVWAWKARAFKGLAILVGLGALFYFLWPYLRNFYLSYILPVLQWIGHIFAVIFGWLVSVLAFLIKWIAALFLVIAACIMVLSGLACIGYFIVDQFRTAWECGSSRKGVILGSLSVGVSLSLIFIVSVGSLQPPSAFGGQGAVVHAAAPNFQTPNTSVKKKIRKGQQENVPLSQPIAPVAATEMGIDTALDLAARHGGFGFVGTSLPRVFTWSLPHSMKEWAAESFHHAHAPVFDAIVLLMVLFISMIGLARGMFTKEKFDLKYKFYNRDFVVLVAVPVFLLILLLSASESNQA